MNESLGLLLVAPPGAGKGTQAPRLAAHYGITHISSGDLLRQNVAERTGIGRTATEYMVRGDLVPDELVMEMLIEPVTEAYGSGGFVLDGFPRTLRQAKEAQRVARQIGGVELQAVIHLVVGRDEIRRRILTRAEEEGRSDDMGDVISHRLEVFDDESQALLGFYADRGLLLEIDGEKTADAVFADIVCGVDSLRGSRRSGEPSGKT